MMPDNKQLNLILGNATRLLDDARLLVDHRRHASAFALAVLGIEEIGKMVLKQWDAEKPLGKSKEWQSVHIQKQTAVASLLLGAQMIRMFPNGIDSRTVDMVAVTNAFNEGEEGKLFDMIRQRALDKRKQSALYQDDDMLVAVEDDFAETHVRAIFKIAHDAQDALAAHGAARAAARAFYETTLDARR